MKYNSKNYILLSKLLIFLMVLSVISLVFLQTNNTLISNNLNQNEVFSTPPSSSGNSNAVFSLDGTGISVSIHVSRSAGDIGQTVTFSSSVTSSTYTYSWSGLPTGCSNSAASSDSCTPTGSGTFTVSLLVADTQSTNYGAATYSYTVSSDPSVGSPYTSLGNSIDLGQVVTIYSATPTGGSGGYSYSWTSLPSPCSNSGTSTVSCTPGATGSYTLTVSVTDSNGYSVSGSSSFSVLKDPSIGTPSANTSSNYLYIGQGVKFTSATPTNGLSPYTYRWNNLPTGCSNSGTTTVSCKPTGSGSFSVSVTITDSNNYQVTSSSLSYTVYNDLSLAAPSFNSTTGSIDLGQAVKFTSATPSGGQTPYSYSWTGLPTGCSDSGVSTVTCTPTATGTWYVTVTITDSHGIQTTSSNVQITVKSAPILSTLTANVTSGGIDPGQSVSFSITASGGTNSFNYLWLNLPTGCSTMNVNSIDCTPAAGGTFNVQVQVTDSNNFVVTNSLSYKVQPSLIVNNITATALSLTVSQSTTLSVVVSGGTGTGTYSYLWNNLPQGCLTSDVSSLLCSPIASGTYSVSVTVTDGNSFTQSSNTTIIVVAGGLSVNAIQTSQSSLDLGQSITFTASPGGGSSPYTYLWFGLPSGCSNSGAASLSCSPTVTGTFNIYVNVTDSNSVLIESPALSFTIFSSPAIQTPSASPSSVDLGQTTTFSTSVNGGSGGDNYLWLSLPSGCTSSNTNSLTCSPTATGSFTIKVNVTDSNGVTVTSSSLSFSVYNKPTVTVPTTTSNGGTTGTKVTFSAAGSGGSGSLTYTWSSSSTSLVCSTSSTNTVSCTPQDPGTYTVTVTVTDSNGGTVSKTSATFTVTGSSISNNTSSTSSTTTPTTSSSSNNNGNSNHTTTNNSNGKSSPGFTGSILVLTFLVLASSAVINRNRKNRK